MAHTSDCAAAPAAGTSIENLATVRYIDSQSGDIAVVMSNIVRVIVQSVESVSIEQDQSIERPPAAQVSFAHRIKNTGNVLTTYTLSAANQSGDQFNVMHLQIIRDTNSNGLADPGEPAINSVTLGIGQIQDLVVIGTVPNLTTNGRADVLVTVSSAQSSASNLDSVTVRDVAVLTMNQTASTLNPNPGETVTLRTRTTNVGKVDAAGASIFVDGNPITKVLLAQWVPANTRFTRVASAPPTSMLLYHQAGHSADRFTTAPAADTREIDAVAYALDEFTVGSTTSLEIQVQVNSNAAGSTTSNADGWYMDGLDAIQDQVNANVLHLTFSARQARITYFTDASFTSEVTHTLLGNSLHIQADAAACNADASVVDTVAITLSSGMGDRETFVATETSSNSGIFRIADPVPTMDSRIQPVVRGDHIFEGHRNEVVTAQLPDCGTGVVQADILIDPAGIVFDSRSNRPITGAFVHLIDVTGAGNGGNPGGDARVFASDGVTPAPAQMVTGNDGRYQFPLVDPSEYRLEIIAPTGYTFPSQVPIAELPSGRLVLPDASYGNSFPVNLITGAVIADIPMDPPQGNLFVENTSSRREAEIGDFVDFTVKVTNPLVVDLPNIVASLALPRGFIYQNGSARINGVFVPDPDGSQGRALNFLLGTIASKGSVTITYRTRVGAAAALGNNQNNAQASTGDPFFINSNVAQATVRIEGGVFDNKAFVLGKVYADCNRDHLQNEGEPGVPGVRIWLEDGTWAQTDAEGMYSFYGLSPRSHVAKVDNVTLPPGVELEALDHRNAEDGSSRFLDLKNGELHRADFAISTCDPASIEEIKRRKVLARRGAEEFQSGASSQLSLQSNPGSILTGQASGVIASQSNTTQPIGSTLIPPLTLGKAGQKENPKSLAESLQSVDGSLGFVDMQDEMILPSPQATVRIKGPQDATLLVKLNDEPLPAERIGIKLLQAEKKLQAVEYIGIPFNVGSNVLSLEQLDEQGAVIKSQILQIKVPGNLAKVIIDPVLATPADGSSIAKIKVHLQDTDGVPVVARTALTLEANSGIWQVEDLDPTQSGTQVFVEGGTAEFKLLSPTTPSQVQLRISSGEHSAIRSLNFFAPLREMLAAGVVEGELSLSKLKVGAVQDSDMQDGFEQEISRFSQANGSPDERMTTAARSALFLKGKVKGEYLLTLGYDSDKNTKERLFRDIQPDKFYPIYGDSSVKGFDAQTTGHLYVRIDKNKSWLLYGDYVTSDNIDPARNLAAYNRSLNGVRHHYEEDRFSIDSFASLDNSRQVVQEIPANGTSGPYALSSADLILNSERVEIVTRDRRQLSNVLKVVPQARFTDYTLEIFTGRLLFRAPIATVDADLNPQFIRVTYEIEQGGQQFWVAGTDVRMKLVDSEKLKMVFGMVAVRDEDPADRNHLYGTNLTVQAGGVTAIVEDAQIGKESTGSGSARRIDIKKEQGDLQGRIYTGTADANFNNPSSILNLGRQESGAKLNYRLNENTHLVADFLSTQDQIRNNKREDLFGGIERSFANNLKLELGIRRYQESVSPTSTSSANLSDETTSVRVKVGAPLPAWPQASIFGEFEQATGDSKRHLLAVGGDYRLENRGRLYGRYEFVSSLASFVDSSTQQRNTTVFGIDSEYMQDGRVFSEYRARNALAGREAEAAIGLRNQWKIAEGILVNTSFERINAVQRNETSPKNDSMAVTGALEYARNPSWKGTARMEWRTSSSSDSMLNTFGVAKKINQDWTLLGRNILSTTHSKTAGVGDTLQERFQFGMAYRDSQTNLWNGLGRYEYKQERDSTPDAGYRRAAHIFSTHANVQPSARWVMTGRYAAKIASDESSGLSGRSVTHLVSARMTYDIAKKWDVGVQASTLFSPGNGNRQDSIGAEVGYLVKKNTWVSVGYNVTGFKDRDLAEDNETKRGIYVRVRFKFDEKLVARFLQ